MINLLLPSAEVKSCIWLNQTPPSPLDLLYILKKNLFPFSLAAAGHERRTRRRREKGAKESGDRCSTLPLPPSTLCLVRHTPLSPLVVAFLSKQWHVGLFSISLASPVRMYSKNMNSPTFVREGEAAGVGIWVWRCCRWWLGELEIIFWGWEPTIVCSVMLIRQSNLAVWRPSATRLCTRKLRRALLSCVLNSHTRERERKQHTHDFLSVSLPFYFFFPLSDTNDCSPHPW